jgi:4'-phosphopantetheinyl transferase
MHAREPWHTRVPPVQPPADGEVHVWQAPLDQFVPYLEELEATLSADEAQRAARFQFDHHRRWYTIGRGLLRVLLGRYTGQKPERIRLRYGPQGKPMLTVEHGWPELHFNASGSQGMALFAFASGREVGIDIEWKRPMPDADQIVANSFAPEEYAIWRTLPAAQRHEAFFACWTRKEAYIKAVGCGLSRELHHFAVTFAPGEPARLLYDHTDPAAVHRWFLRALTLDPDHAAALCLEGPIGDVTVSTLSAIAPSA